MLLATRPAPSASAPAGRVPAATVRCSRFQGKMFHSSPEMRSCAPLDAAYDGEIEDFATAGLWPAYLLSHTTAETLPAGALSDGSNVDMKAHCRDIGFGGEGFSAFPICLYPIYILGFCGLRMGKLGGDYCPY